jgi:hypothetical protein
MMDTLQTLLSPHEVGGLILYRKSDRKGGVCLSRGRPLLKAINHDQKQVVFFRPRCGLWSCPSCAEINASRVVLQAAHGAKLLAEAGAALDFVTITPHERLSPRASRVVLPSAWSMLRKRFARATTSGHQYFVVPEQHKSGKWHLHAITAFHLPKRWWKNNARECGFGYQVDVQKIDHLGQVSAYIGKYIGKNLNDQYTRSLRHVLHSNRWPKLPDIPEPAGWEFLLLKRDQALNEEVARAQGMGYVVVLADESSSWDWIGSLSSRDD